MKNFAKNVASLAWCLLAAAACALALGVILGPLDLIFCANGPHYLYPDWMKHALEFIMGYGFFTACVLLSLAAVLASLAKAFKPGRRFEFAGTAITISGLSLLAVVIAVMFGGIFGGLDMPAGSLIGSQPVLTASARSIIDGTIRYGLWSAAVSATLAIVWAVGSAAVSAIAPKLLAARN
jgi:hypothetical protein